jgi:Phosphatidylinositol-specific phospholipase C, X domain
MLKLKGGADFAKEVDFLFSIGDKGKDGALSVDEVAGLFERINVSISKRKLQKMFKDDDVNADGKLTKSEFSGLYEKLIQSGSQIRVLFDYLSEGKAVLSKEKFNDFLKSQRDTFTKLSTKNEVTFAEFSAYIQDDTSALYDFSRRELNMDMALSWTAYWINSSHNTYLTGDQLKSTSSIDAYVYALILGCRCVELDVWDGPNGPQVYHGYTMTSKIPFRNVIDAIKSNAFAASQFPLILSLEVHCSTSQQDQMAEILVDILGDLLLKRQLGTVPSPDALKGKIIIKGKAVPADEGEHNDGTESDGESAESISSTPVSACLPTDESLLKRQDSIPRKVNRKDRYKLSHALGKLAIYQVLINNAAKQKTTYSVH